MLRRFTLLLLGFLVFILPFFSQTIMAQGCDRTMKYNCIDGTGNIIGNVEVPAMPSGLHCTPGLGSTLTEACKAIGAMCNSTFPALCQGNCTAGDAMKIGQSCRGTPTAPSQNPALPSNMPSTPSSTPM